ncbi:hypothetical protein M9Y10_024033 [Tritrichomonas musculus]|uniref:AP complex subunit beta n=1 Tax=Tritrichomonas musculus TaxID=1915356 RepID=A0ABR2KXH4_9EUKA
MNSNPSISNEFQEANRNLTSKDIKVRNDGLKQIINLFGQGENCSSISPQVCVFQADDNVTSHRFVNIINDAYFKENQNLSQAIISSLLTDFDRSNTQIKALAVRQAGSIINNENAPELVPIIKAGAVNNDPYVRKAAAMSILKAYQNSPYILYHYELSPVLKTLIEDSNPNVSSNAVCAYTEINNTLSTPLFEITIEMVGNLLNTIEDATEWSQIQILEFISDFKPDQNDAYTIIQKISTRLIQANSGITISAVRCCLKMCQIIDEPDFTKETFDRIMISLVSLFTNGHGIQYSVLKSIFVILQKFRQLFEDEVDLFFCKYDDPLYIKLEKIDIILTLTNDKSITKVLEELSTYAAAQQEDIELVRKSIRAIGRLAIVFEKMSKSCVDYLESLIMSRIQYVVQECIVVSVNIFRRYPGQYLHIISTICQCLSSTIDDHRAKAAMVWILGEYSTMITNAAELIDALFLESFLEEPNDVQLSILTAVVKFFLCNPEEGIEMLRHVLSLITNEVDNPDLKDRAYMYLLVLTECPERAMNVVMAPEPPMLNIDMQLLEPRLVEALVPLVGSLAVIYKKFPQEFVPSLRRKPPQPTQQQQQQAGQQDDKRQAQKEGQRPAVLQIKCQSMTTQSPKPVSRDVEILVGDEEPSRSAGKEDDEADEQLSLRESASRQSIDQNRSENENDDYSRSNEEEEEDESQSNAV